jgi:hypothetical protein
MITATYKNNYNQENTVKVDHLVNRGDWYGKTWLIGVGLGYSSFYYVVEARCESDAIDVLADSKHGHMIDGEVCDNCAEQNKLYQQALEAGTGDYFDFNYDDCYCDTAGNDSHPVNLDNVYMWPCKVNYFAKSDSLLL